MVLLYRDVRDCGLGCYRFQRSIFRYIYTSFLVYNIIIPYLLPPFALEFGLFIPTSHESALGYKYGKGKKYEKPAILGSFS